MPDDRAKYSFEEFKLFYESTEKVTDRRLSTNRWNYGVCLGILGGIAALTKWYLPHPPFFVTAICAIVVLCALAWLFCTLWLDQIQDFKALNGAKFNVLNDMAPKIDFDAATPDVLQSFEPFKREWEMLEQMKALDELAKSNRLALKSSNIELFMPKAFRWIFVFIAVAAIGIFVYYMFMAGLSALPEAKAK